MLIVVLIVVIAGYGLVYGGAEVAKEGAKNWGTYRDEVRASGTGAQRAAVETVGFFAWVAKTAGRGIRNAAREDRELIRHRRSPEGKKERAEARAHRENRQRRKREYTDQARIQRQGAREARAARAAATPPAADPFGEPTWVDNADDSYVTCPFCAGAGCSHCDDGSGVGVGTVPKWVADDATTPDLPAASAAGTPAMNGAPMGTATGEALTFEQMQAQIAALGEDGRKHAEEAARIAEAAERLDAAAQQHKLDDATRAALNRISVAATESAEIAGQIPGSAAQAGNTLTAQQGNLHEAHAAQPQAADENFLKAG